MFFIFMTMFLLFACIHKDLVPGYPDVTTYFNCLNLNLCIATIILLFPGLIIPELAAGKNRH